MARLTSVTRTDPLRDFKFRVQIFPSADLDPHTQGIGGLGFAVVSGISVQNEMIAYREGGMNTHPHKMVGQSDFAPVTFSRGIFAGANQAQLWNWQRFIHSWMQADPAGSVSGSDYRADITVTVYDHPTSAYSFDTNPAVPTSTPQGAPRFKYTLFNCWPGSYSIGDLNAGNSSIMIQQMTIHHEGFVIDFNPSTTGISLPITT